MFVKQSLSSRPKLHTKKCGVALEKIITKHKEMKNMKKFTACLICIAMLLSLAAASSVSAQEIGAASVSAVQVPQLHISTANGNGISLEKEDGYTDAQFSVGDEAGEHIIMKVRGNSTAMTAKKSFTFKFDSKKDLFGMGKAKKWALLANPFDPTLLRNYIAFDFAQELGLEYTSNQKIVELWLDGRFRGCYTLMEPVEAGSNRVDINTDGSNDFMLEYESLRTDEGTSYITVDGLRFGVSEPDEPDNDQLGYITNTLTQLTNTINSGDRAAIEASLDIPSFVKFYILNEFIKTNDFNFSSVNFYYKDGKFYAGPPWDYDLSMGNVNKDFSSNSAAAFRTDGEFINNKLFYKKLCSYDWFMQEVRREYALHADYIRGIYTTDGLIDTLVSDYSEVFSRNYNEAGWSIRYLINVMMYPLPTYDENLAFLKNWLAERDAWLCGYYEIPSLRYMIGDSDGNGKITINDATYIQYVLAELLNDEDGGIALRGNVTGESLRINDATEIQKYLVGLDTSYRIGEYLVM